LVGIADVVLNYPERAIILSRQMTDVALFDRLAGARKPG